MPRRNGTPGAAMGVPQMNTPEFPAFCRCRHSTSRMKFSYCRDVRNAPVGRPVQWIIPSRTLQVSGAQFAFTHPVKPPLPLIRLRQLPALAILAADERLRRARVCRAELGRIPLDLLTGPIRDVAQVVCLRQPAGILEVASGRLAGFAGVNPFRV